MLAFITSPNHVSQSQQYPLHEYLSHVPAVWVVWLNTHLIPADTKHVTGARNCHSLDDGVSAGGPGDRGAALKREDQSISFLFNTHFTGLNMSLSTPYRHQPPAQMHSPSSLLSS